MLGCLKCNYENCIFNRRRLQCCLLLLPTVVLYKTDPKKLPWNQFQFIAVSQGEKSEIYECIDLDLQYKLELEMELKNKNNSKQPTYENEMRNLSDEQNDYVVPQPVNNINQNTQPYQNLDARLCHLTDRKNIIITALASLSVILVALVLYFALRDGKTEVDGVNLESNGDGNRWTQWSSWGQCYCTNRTTTQQRLRFCMSTKKNQKLDCPGPDIETQYCLSSVPCFQDGWTDWSSWGQCSCLNGTETQQRHRFCMSTMENQELYCTGSDIETQNCSSSSTCFASNENGWSEWSSWGQCSCWNGTATQHRLRLCTSTKEYCPGQDTEARNCSISTPCLRDENPCKSSPCTNGSTCVDVNVDTFICVCRGGFFGVTCENSEYHYTVCKKRKLTAQNLHSQ